MLKKILVALVVLVGAFVAVVAAQSPSYSLDRRLEMDAPPAEVYEQVADFHNWRNWSPWDELDPEMKRSYSGPDSGVGAGYAWQGNDQVGRGKMEITEASPPNGVTIALTFEEPFSSDNVTRFTITPKGDKTEVIWSMDGDKGGFIGKAMGLFVDFDEMVGRDLTKGLSTLAVAAKKSAETNAAVKKAADAAKAAAEAAEAASEAAEEAALDD